MKTYKKIIITLIFTSMALLPLQSHAQIVNVEYIRTQLQEILKMVLELQNKIAALREKESAINEEKEPEEPALVEEKEEEVEDKVEEDVVEREKDVNELILETIDPRFASVGDTVTIYGSGFKGNIRLYFREGFAPIRITNLNEETKDTLTFVVPDFLYSTPVVCTNTAFPCPQVAQIKLPVRGTFSLWIENERGTSNTLELSIRE